MDLKKLEEKVLNSEELTIEELQYIAYKMNVIEEINGDDHRWQKEKSIIFEIQGRYFCLDYLEGLTEMQDDYFFEQPYEVIKKEKTIVINEWVAKEK